MPDIRVTIDKALHDALKKAAIDANMTLREYVIAQLKTAICK